MVDHDVHFRAGVGPSGIETFTPRTLIYDLKGGFGSMRKLNALYDLEQPKTDAGAWSASPIAECRKPALAEISRLNIAEE